jgi:hypothetical protein
MRPWLLALPLATLLGCLVPTGFGTGRGGNEAGGGDDLTTPRITPLPTTISDMLPFLAEGDYVDYPTTPTITGPQGPHGLKGVRAYYHPALVASLESGALEHPKGAGAILELYAADGVTRYGWAVSVKVDAVSDGGFGWLWLEAVETPNGPKLVDDVESQYLCIKCHASGDDFVIGVAP